MQRFTVISWPINSLKAMTNVKVEPWPHSDLTIILPPNYFTIIYEIWRPKPMPLVFRSLVESKNPKTLKSLSWSSYLMPVPVS